MIHYDPRVMATLSVDEQPAGEEYSVGVLARIRHHWERYGIGARMLFEKDGKPFRRLCRNSRHIELEGAPEIELLYTIRSDR